MRALLIIAFVFASALSSASELKAGAALYPEEEPPVSSKPLFDVAVLGAPATGALVEGVVGSIQKGCRHRFYCQTSSPAQGFLGPRTIAEPLSIKDQPGVFPAPLMGPAALTFSFKSRAAQAPFTPIIIRPDGAVVYGQPMTAVNSPQTLVIASPAQTGIYTLIILAHQKDSEPARATVEASVSTQPKEAAAFPLNSFDAKSDSDLVSAEFIYIPVR